MEDWQLAVLNSENIAVKQDSRTGYRLVIKQVEPRDRMPIQTVVEFIRKSTRKPVIMLPDDPTRGAWAEKKQVLEVLRAREDYAEYMCMLMEAKMSGVI